MINARKEIRDYREDVERQGLRNATENIIERIFNLLEDIESKQRDDNLEDKNEKSNNSI